LFSTYRNEIRGRKLAGLAESFLVVVGEPRCVPAGILLISGLVKEFALKVV
jgi:hypothetical protein